MDNTAIQNANATYGTKRRPAVFKALTAFVLALIAAFTVSLATVDEAQAKTYTGTWNPPAITNGGWVNLSTSISVSINYVEGSDTMTVSFWENWTSFGKSQLYGDGFKDGFCLITPPTTGYGDTHMMGCNRGSGPTDTHDKARRDFQSWADRQGSTLIFYASQSNANDRNTSKGGALSYGGTYIYDLRGYRPGDTPVLLWYGNRYQTPYNGSPGQSFVYHYSTLTTADFGMTIKIAPKVTSSSGTGGSITPAGTISYPYEGNSSVYTWSRNYGYALKDVIIDGQHYGTSKNSHQFLRMTEHHTIAVEWLELGDISLSKVTGDSSLSVTDRYSLANAQYILYTDAACTQRAKDVEGKNIIMTTDSAGRAKTAKVVYPGTYYMKETIPSKGFRLDPTVHTVTVTSGKTSSVTSYEQPQRGYITVQKNSSAPSLTNNNDCYTLEGAKYEVIRDGAVVATLTTDKTGKTNTFTAPLGNYTVREKTPSTGFRLDHATYSVNIAADEQSKTFSSTEVPLIDTYPLALHKMDREAEDTHHADTPQGGLSLEGAQYSVKYYDGYYSSVLQTAPLASKWEKTFTTSYDPSSRAFFEVLADEMFNDGTGQMGWLLGTYVVEEVKAPYGYFLDARNPYVMQITKASADTAESHVVTSPGSSRTDAGAANTHITNTNAMLSSDEPQRSNLMIMIYGEKSTDPDQNPDGKPGLPGVSFNIINESPNDVYSFERGVWVKPGEVVVTITSNGDGYCNTQDPARIGGKSYYLPIGEYRVHPVEETIPEGYKQPEDMLLDVTVPQRTYRWIIEDKIGTVLRIDKIDEDTGKAVSGFASFEIYNKDTGEQIVQQADYPSSAIMSRFTTDVTGKVTLPDKLMGGNYFIREVKAPAGYDLAQDVENDIPFAITSDTVNTYDDPLVIKFGNHATRAKLRVSVVDNDSGAYILGSHSHVKVYAQDEVVTPDGTVRFTRGQLVYEGDTDPSKGFVDAKGLYPGKYRVEQVTAPNGYALNDETYTTSLTYINDTASPKGEVKIPNKSQKSDIATTLVQEDSSKPIQEPGGIFDIIAAEDIVTPDGTIQHYKGDVVEQITTDQSGEGKTTEPLHPGKYVAIQTDAPDGYVPDEDPVNITITSSNDGSEEGEPARFVKTNSPQYGIIQVEKQDDSTAQNVLVAGCEFAVFANEDIYTSDGEKQFSNGEEVTRMVTRADGKATSGYLNIGSYKIKEITAPEGYMNDKQAEAFANIAYEEDKPYSEAASTGVFFANKAARGSVDVTKVDSGTKKPIREEGIAIDVVAAEDIVTPDGTVRYRKGDLVASAFTDADGTAHFENLYIGKYCAIQKSPADGYDINENPIAFEIGYKNGDEEPQTPQVTIEDDVLTGFIRLNKIVSGSVDDQPIKSSAATFRITADEDIKTSDGTVRFTRGQEIATVKTKDGVAEIGGLYSGRYKAEEIEAPYGYVADGQVYIFDVRYGLVIDAQENQTYTLDETFTIANSVQKSSIEIINKDSETGEPITSSSATFDIVAKEDIYTPEGEKIYSAGDVVVSVETGEDGSVKVDDLPIGKYEVVMTKPSNGYSLDSTPRPVETKYDSSAGTDGVTETVVFASSMPTAHLGINKINEYDNEVAVEGAEFTLSAKEDIVRGDGSVIIAAGDVVDAQITGKDGVASFAGVRQGTYVLSETKVPDGYIACEDQEVAVKYVEGETEIIMGAGEESNENDIAADNIERKGNGEAIGDVANKNENADSVVPSDDVDHDKDADSDADADVVSVDSFEIILTITNTPRKASIEKVGPLGGHIAGCDLSLYMYDGNMDDEIESIEDVRDKVTLVDQWTTIDKIQAKQGVEAGKEKESASDGDVADDEKEENLAAGTEANESGDGATSDEGNGKDSEADSENNVEGDDKSSGKDDEDNDGKGDENKDDGDALNGIHSKFDGTAYVVHPLAAGTYILVEDKPAAGYDFAKPIVFQITEDDETVEVEMVDQYAKVADELIEDSPLPSTAEVVMQEVISEYGDTIWRAIAVIMVTGGVLAWIIRRKKMKR